MRSAVASRTTAPGKSAAVSPSATRTQSFSRRSVPQSTARRSSDAAATRATEAPARVPARRRDRTTRAAPGKARVPVCLVRLPHRAHRATRRAVRAASLLLALVTLASDAGSAGARAGAVATEHPLAAAAGVELLRAGGTAVDAAIAAAAAVCVVHASSCGVGGGGFALVHRADGRDFALDYREVAPAGATPERFRARGKLEPALPRTGGLLVGVPVHAAG